MTVHNSGADPESVLLGVEAGVVKLTPINIMKTNISI